MPRLKLVFERFRQLGQVDEAAAIRIVTRQHRRGPVGVEQLTSFKYRVRGNGQIRP